MISYHTYIMVNMLFCARCVRQYNNNNNSNITYTLRIKGAHICPAV